MYIFNVIVLPRFLRAIFYVRAKTLIFTINIGNFAICYGFYL